MPLTTSLLRTFSLPEDFPFETYLYRYTDLVYDESVAEEIPFEHQNY